MATAAISATPVSDLRARGVKGSTTWQQAWQAGAQRRMERVEPTGEALGDRQPLGYSLRIHMHVPCVTRR